MTALPRNHANRSNRNKGFTLIEVLVGALVALTALASLLLFHTALISAFGRMDVRWRAALRCWNRSQQWKADPAAGHDEWLVPEGAVRPLRFRRIEEPGGPAWEVLNVD